MTAEPDPLSTCIEPEPFLKMTARRGVRRDFYVVHHPPADHEGNDFYAAYRARNRGYRCYIGYTMFETDRLPPGWAEACNGMDEIWVPSRFNVDTFQNSGVDPDKLHIIPVAFDAKPYRNLPPSADISGRRGFNFLSVFQWSHRKGADLLIRAYLETFKPDEDVSLIIRSFAMNGESVSGRLLELIQSMGFDPRTIPDMVLLDDPIQEADMPALYRAADAFVLPSRGEGWGLPYMEAMASGLPTIGTRWSGNLEFMHDDNAYLIDINGLVPVHDEEVKEMPHYAGHSYADPDVDHLKRLMRHVFENRAEAQQKGALARSEVLSGWTEHQASEKMMNRFRTLRQQWKKQARATVAFRWKVDDAFAEAIRSDPDTSVVTRGKHRVTIHRGDPTSAKLDESAAFNVARSLFDTDALPPEWIPALNRFDEVWVPSDFNLRAYHEAGVDWNKLVKIPGCVDAYRYGPHLDRCTIEPDLGFVFLSVFPWTLRSGWDRLLEAYCREFDRSDDVTLFLKVEPSAWTSQASIEEEIFAYIRSELGRVPEECPRIKLHAETFLDMPMLYRAADAFVLPTRGEGWGRYLLEAMVSGLPAIATRHGGHLEFMNERNARLLECKRVTVPTEFAREHPEFTGLHWVEPDGNDLRQAMREAFEDPEGGQQRGLAAREEVAEKFSMQRTAALVRERVEQIGRPADLSTTESGVRLVMEGSFFCMSSLALVNREAGRALVERNRVALSSKPLEGTPSLEEEERFLALKERVNHRFSKPAEIHVWHQWPPSPAVPPSGRWVIWQGWEYGSLPAKIVTLVNSGVDEVWTYSNHCAHEFAADGIPEEKIGVIPLGVDPDRFRPHAPVPEKLQRLTRKKTVFLFVGGTIWRKGIDLLLSSFCRTFTRDDDVALVVKEMGSDSFYQKYNLTETVEKLASFPEAPEIVLLKDKLTDAEMPGLYNACTCLVHPYRGEGFGLPVLEAMACGLPVIVTTGGACDDFVRPEAAFTLPAHQKKVPLPLETARPTWVMEPDRAALMRSMKQLAEDPDPAIARALAESHRIRTDWTWNRTAQAIEARCEALVQTKKNA